MVIGRMETDAVLLESSDAARDLYSKSGFGSPAGAGRTRISLLEASYLLEKGKISVQDGRGKALDIDAFIRRVSRTDKAFWTRHKVFADLRGKGYIVKTALKFGADFRVYEKGIKPGDDHAKWIVFPVHERNSLTWHEFSSKARVAHSTRKQVLIAIVDDEGDVTYYQADWTRP